MLISGSEFPSVGSCSMGLLLCHIGTLSVVGDVVTFSRRYETPPPPPHERGDVGEFSPRSRWRLLKMIHSIEFERVAFLTLTYGSTFPRKAGEYKYHLHKFRIYLKRLMGAEIRAVWRLEFQKRGAPHYHLIIFDPPFLPVQKINDLWDKVTGRPEAERFGNSVDLKLATERDQERLIAKYISKYAAKVSEGLPEGLETLPGRYWGKWGIKCPQAKEYELTYQQMERVAASLLLERKNQDWVPGDLLGFTLFGESIGTDTLAKRVDRLVCEIIHK